MLRVVLFVVLSVTIIVGLTNCNHDSAGNGNPYTPKIANDTVIMPVNYRNYWTYSSQHVYNDAPEYDTTFTYTLDSLVHWNNTSWYYYSWIGLCIQNYPGGLWSKSDSVSDSSLYLKFPVAVGEEWNWMSTTTACISTTDTAIAMNRTYYNCIRYRTTFTSGHYTDQVMKPGIGLLCSYTDTSLAPGTKYRVTKLTGYRNF